MRIHEIPKQDRPREKLMERGAGSLTDAELLAIFLRTGRKGKSAIALAGELLKYFGTLRMLSRAKAAELKKSGIGGIGLAKAAELAAAFELGKRLARGEEERPLLDHAEAIHALLAEELAAMNREVIKVLLLDTKLRLIRVEDVALGSLNECVAHPREIFRSAMIHSAYGIVLVHNHPSGDPSPSQADRQLTRRLAEVAGLLQIQFLDHIICGTSAGGRSPYYSFRDSGSL